MGQKYKIFVSGLIINYRPLVILSLSKVLKLLCKAMDLTRHYTIHSAMLN